MTRDAPLEIWLVQYLCPSRHCIAAVPYDPDHLLPEDAEHALLEGLEQCGVHPWCGLCGSRALYFEHAKTRFTDWDTARKALFACEADQQATRAAFGLDTRKN